MRNPEDEADKECAEEGNVFRTNKGMSPKNRLSGKEKHRGERRPQAHPAAGKHVKRINTCDEGDEVNEMAKIRDDPARMDGVEPARNQHREHDESRAIVIVRVTGDDDLCTGQPGCIRGQRVISVLEKLKFIPRLAKVGQREQTDH